MTAARPGTTDHDISGHGFPALRSPLKTPHSALLLLPNRPNLLRVSSAFTAVVGRAFARHMMPLIVSPFADNIVLLEHLHGGAHQDRKAGILYP